MSRQSLEERCAVLSDALQDAGYKIFSRETLVGSPGDGCTIYVRRAKYLRKLRNDSGTFAARVRLHPDGFIIVDDEPPWGRKTGEVRRDIFKMGLGEFVI